MIVLGSFSSRGQSGFVNKVCAHAIEPCIQAALGSARMDMLLIVQQVFSCCLRSSLLYLLAISRHSRYMVQLCAR